MQTDFKIIAIDSFFDTAKELDDNFNEQDDITAAQEQLINDEY